MKKVPTEKELKEAIESLENLDYKYAGGFQGVNVYDIKLQDLDELDEDEERKIYYTADVCYDRRKDTHYDCWIKLRSLKSFLPKHYSLK